jgi:hypothetical protein
MCGGRTTKRRINKNNSKKNEIEVKNDIKSSSNIIVLHHAKHRAVQVRKHERQTGITPWSPLVDLATHQGGLREAHRLICGC